MQLDTLIMPEEDARARLAEYETALKTERTAEDEAIALGYRAAARGLPVIMLTSAFAAGGFHDNGLPKLAIARATAEQCWVGVDGWKDGTRTLVFRDAERADNRGALVGQHTVRVGPIAYSGPEWNAHGSRRSGRTIVPLIPPRHRPRARRLRGFHILWEVDEWTPAPPVDPALIRHIRGDLWSVVATWDLTPLERAVLTARNHR